MARNLRQGIRSFNMFAPALASDLFLYIAALRFRLIITLATVAICFPVAALIFPAGIVFAQEITVVKQFTLSGIVKSIRRDQIVIINEDGNVQTLKYQQEEDGVIAVNGGAAVIEASADIKVSGKLPAKVLRIGSMIETTISVTRAGRSQTPVNEIQLLSLDSPASVVELTKPAATGEAFSAKIVGRIVGVSEQSAQVEIPSNEFIAKNPINVLLSEDTAVRLEDNDLNYVQPGDVVTQCAAGELSTGDLVVREIQVELLPRDQLVSASLNERLQLEFAQLSNIAPEKVRVERSKHFILHTDISDRRVQILLHKLETMVELVSDYYRTPPKQIIECYVVEDLSRWPANQFDQQVVDKIQAKEGFTVTAIRGNERKSIVYSFADDAIVQHEAVHGYCNQTFPSPGPFWYAEGMAELGKYWKPGELDVSVHPVVLEYLRNSKRKSLDELIVDQRVVQVGWQDYAWRWAVCHFLSSNPNYSTRFKALGSNLLNQRKNDSFGDAFSKQEQELRFEFDFFIQHLQNDLRADLVAWQWDKRPRSVTNSRKAASRIRADLGWQATGANLEAGKQYEISASGEWSTLGEATPVDADGNPDGKGRLVGVIFKDYVLSETFELGKAKLFQVPTGGHLFVRCKDDWADLDDNQGQVSVEIRIPKQSQR